MIKLFKATDKTYSSNGDIVLETAKAHVIKEDNGEFYLDLEAPLKEKEVARTEASAGTTVEGTSFNIDVDLTKEYEIQVLKGQTEQASTPTPSSPVFVNTVTGRQDIQVNETTYEVNLGKNLFDTNNVLDSDKNKRLNTSGAYYTEQGYFVSNMIKIEPSTTYTISYVPTAMTRVCFYSSNTTSAFISKNDSQATFTTPNNAQYLMFCNLITQMDTIQLEKGSQATSYAPYKTPIELCKIGNYQDFIRKGTGVNLLNIENLVSGYWYLNGTLTSNQNWSYVNQQIQVKPNTTYTLSRATTSTTASQFSIEEFDSSGNFVKHNALWQTTGIHKYTITTQPETAYVYCQWNNTYSYNDIMFTEGDTRPTLYEPFGYEGIWYIYKAIGKIDLSTITWNSAGHNVTNYRRYYTNTIPNIKYVSSNQVVGDGLAEKYKLVKGSGISNVTDCLAIDVSIVSVCDTASPTGNFYYALATPYAEQIEDTEILNQLSQIELVEGTNNIMLSSPYLPFIMTLHYNFSVDRENKLKYIDYLVPNNIIVANTPQGEQAFRISNVENTNRKIKVRANHVFYDSQNYLIRDSYVVDKNCNDALDHLNSATDNTSPFTTISDITKIASYRCVRKSLYEAIQVILERWGGHLVRDNWTIGIRNEIGQDNGVTLRYGKNIKDISATYNWDNVCTKLLPVGKDGILLNAIDPLESVYLVSETQYDLPYTKTVSFSQDDIDEDDYRDEETGEINTTAYTQALINDLIEQGQNYLQANSTPMVNYTLSANVEKISDVGDTIQVTDEKLGIDILTNIISYEYDCILDKYVELEFGNFTPTLSGLLNTISKQTEEIVDEKTTTLQVTLGEELNEATNKIWNALGNSYVIYEGDKILIVDALPKESATNVIMLNNGGIGFSNTGINGTFNSAWTIDNVLNMEQINVINLTADLVKGGTLKLGSALNQNGQLEVYDESNTLIAELNKNGLKMYGVDGSYILMNNTVGFSGYDRNDNAIYWVSKDEFHMKKSVVEEEITLCTKLRFIPIEIYSGNNLVNDGIGLVSVAGGGS